MVRDTRTIAIPDTYVTALDSPIRISNFPDSACGVTSIQVVTLNRPDKLNAITPGMIHSLIAFFSTVDVDDRVKVVILTGAGRAFSAGIDLNGDYSQEKNQVRPTEIRDPGGTLALSMFNCSKPIIVAYNGLSVGIGMTSTLAAAIRSVSFFIHLVFNNQNTVLRRAIQNSDSHFQGLALQWSRLALFSSRVWLDIATLRICSQLENDFPHIHLSFTASSQSFCPNLRTFFPVPLNLRRIFYPTLVLWQFI